MTDREKIIKDLSELHGSRDTMEIIKEAIVLLKQEPVKPTWTCGKPFCGVCGYWIPGGKFCSHCGKAVKWE